MNLLSANPKRKKIRAGFLCLLLSGLLLLPSHPVFAETVQERIERQREMPIDTDAIENWPTGPVVTAESAILMDADTGTILYAKNIHTPQYPASTTKILTTLIISERCELDEWVTFSKSAVFDTPRDSNHIAIDVGQALTVEDCLNAILIRSANEVCFACAEHITGTNWQDFADIMNERAAELGCVDSHFVNPNGLPDPEHYTSAYDLATIGRAFFANELLCKISVSPRLHLLPTDRQPNEKIENSKNELLPGKTYAYPYLVGTKTGYTDAARHSLVSCAEKDGMKLICVVLHDEAPYQYEDTLTLFAYGFNNFSKINISETESKYDIDNKGLFYNGYDIFGNSRPLLSLNKEDAIILPNTLDFGQVQSTISYDTEVPGQAALIRYSYRGVELGTASVDFTRQPEGYHFEDPDAVSEEPEKKPVLDKVIFINIGKVLSFLLAAALLVFLVLTVRRKRRNRNPFDNPKRSPRNSRREWKKRQRRSHRRW